MKLDQIIDDCQMLSVADMDYVLGSLQDENCKHEEINVHSTSAPCFYTCRSCKTKFHYEKLVKQDGTEVTIEQVEGWWILTPGLAHKLFKESNTD